MNKKSLYWTLQIVGWTIYGLLNIYLAFLGERLSTEQAIGQLILVPFYIVITHLYRNFIIRNGWLQLSYSKIGIKSDNCLSGTFNTELCISIFHFFNTRINNPRRGFQPDCNFYKYFSQPNFILFMVIGVLHVSLCREL